MRLFYRRPSPERIQQMIGERTEQSCTYLNGSVTLDWTVEKFMEQPDRYVDDGYLYQFRTSPVGQGEEDYQKAVRWIREGECFSLDWVECHRARPFQAEDTFGLIARVGPIHAANFCRIVYVEEEDNNEHRLFSVGIGTLDDHAAVGEERLSAHWSHVDDKVHVFIGSLSRPCGPLSSMFAFYLRRQQKRFARETIANLLASTVTQEL